LSPKTLTNFYRRTIESILLSCIIAWYGNCTAFNRKAPQRVVQSAQSITGGKLPALQDTYSTRSHRKAKKIIEDYNHPSHCLFTPLPSRRRGQYRCIKAGTERHVDMFTLLISYVYTVFYTICCILPMPLGHRSSIYLYLHLHLHLSHLADALIQSDLQIAIPLPILLFI
jgi:hypothetical protein